VAAKPRVRGDRGGQNGFVLTWVAIMLVVLVAFAGVAVDVGNWYFVANREQKAADAGALAGAVFLPATPATGKSQATNAVNLNGFTSGQGDTITSVQGSQPNQMQVTVTRTVNNFFLGLIGVGTTTITRSAVAEYQGPIPMGSPTNRLGDDPEGGPYPDFWINIGAPNSDKTNGDRFASKNCPATTYQCTAATPQNNEYLPKSDGYSFAVHVTSTAAAAGRPLVVQAWDGEFAYVGDHCASPAWPTAAQLTALQSTTPSGAPAGYYSDASTRYASGDTGTQAHWCTGDTNNGGFGEITTFVLRSPDTTPYNDFDNPVISTGTCQPVQTPTYDLGASTTPGPTLYQLLNPADNSTPYIAAQHVYDSSNDFTAGGLTFVETFRRWITTCSIPSGSVTTGDYMLQIRSNAAVGAPLVYDPTVDTSGYNRLALRAGWQNADGTVAANGVAIYGNGTLPIFANSSSSAASTFYLARVLPSAGQRVLQVPLYDMGDASVAGTLELLGPDGNDWTNCSFLRSFASTVVSANCTLTGVSGGAGYNGQLVTISAPIPSTYTCTTSDPNACWFKIRATFSGGVEDTTTWQAYMLGDPVHLVQ
jgi:hypothetical protein